MKMSAYVLHMLFVYISSLSLLCLLACIDKPHLGEALISKEIHLNNHLYSQVFKDDFDKPSRRRKDTADSIANSTLPEVKPNKSTLFGNSSVITLVHLNDSHEQLTVHWVGKNSPIIICLAKNRKFSRRNQSSAVYISHNYGQTFEKIIDFKLTDSSPATIGTFYISPVLNSCYLFVDTTHNCTFITKDGGKNFQRIELSFKPKTFQLHPTIPNLILASSSIYNSADSSLFVSENFGFSWKKIQDKIGYFFWTVDDAQLGHDLKTIFVLRKEPNGLSTIISSSDLFAINSYPRVWLNGVEEIEINGRFIFATRRVSLFGETTSNSTGHDSYQLWISVNRKDFFRAVIPTLSSRPINYHVADATHEIIFLAVTFQNGFTHLYTSDSKFEVFSLVLENILYFNSNITKNLPNFNLDASEREFCDLHQVAGIRGTYIASKWRNSTKKSSISDIRTLITYNWGKEWHPIKAPGVNALGHETCNVTAANCSLHLVQKYVSLNSNVKPILTRESSVGFIMATGVVGESLRGPQGIYLSIDAGNTWRNVLSRNFLYTFGDATIVAIAHFSKGGVTNELYYSLDDGDNFTPLQFSKDKIRVYGLLTEPGEKTTVFTIFGSKEKSHEWIVIQANFSLLFRSQCRFPNDYKEWSPHDFESDCLLGSTQIFQRRIGSRQCYNGGDFIRPTAKISCPCKYSDYECDVGYKLDHSHTGGGMKCVSDENYGDASDSDQANCQPGRMFNKTKGYRKLPGNTCEGGEEDWYSPQILPCPFTANESEFILFVQRQDISMISLNSKEFSKNSIVPRSFLSNAIAADFDIKKSCIFWSDISSNRIMRLCMDGVQVKPDVLVETELYSVEGIAFNQINRHLYFVNGFKSKVELINVDAHHEGRMRRSIISKPNVDKPRGIALDPISCYLFVTDWSSNNPAIVRSELDGQNIKVLFNSNTVSWPNGITVDQRIGRIYWVDAKHDYIASSDYDGKDLKYLVRGDQAQNILAHPFALGVFKDFIFYDDWNLHKLILINKYNSSNRKEILSDVTGAMDLKIITPFYNNRSNICNLNSTCEHLCVSKPFNSFTCLCPDGFRVTKTPDGNEKCSCPPNEEMTSTGACKPLWANVTCSHNEFKCDNGNCISLIWKCDGENECLDKSDETNCEENVCKPGEFQCVSNKKCISDIWKCDYSAECPDRSDEDINLCSGYYQKCNLTTSIQCDNYRCISLEQKCNRVADCEDGKDEINCPFHSTIESLANNDCLDDEGCKNHTCSNNDFKCSEFLCIDQSWRCDNDFDCPLGKDEINCTNTLDTHNVTASFDSNLFLDSNCPDGWLQCRSEKCIPLEWHCDHVKDCPGDGSDEIGCFFDHEVFGTRVNISDNNQTDNCGPNKFFCYNSSQCILSSYVCDNDKDCIAGEDELNCQLTNFRIPCPANSYSCILSSECVPLQSVCNGEANCEDSSDEWACENIRLPVPGICLGFQCKSGECISSRLKCDGVPSCIDESDETNCENEKMFAVEELHVVLNSITSNSFSVAWASPNSSLQFLYMPSYSNYAEDDKPVNTSWTDSLSYTFMQLLSGNTYKVSVFCKYIDLNSHLRDKVFPPTSFIKVTTMSVAPRPPENFTAEQVGYNRVLLKWRPPMINEPIKGYKIYYSPPYPESRKVLDYKTEQYELSGTFAIGVTHTFWVTTLTKNLESTDSSKVSLVIDPVARIIELRQKELTNSSVLLEWISSPSTLSKWFLVYRCDDYLPTFVKNLTTNENEAFISHLSPGVNYQFRLYPILNGTILYDGVQDNLISVRTLGSQLPSIGVDSTVSGSAVSLQWSAPTRFHLKEVNWEYAVFVGLRIGDLKLFARTRDTKMVLKNLFSCEHYIVQVRVIEPFGIGPAQHEHKFYTTFDSTAPPKNLKCESASSENTLYRVTWDASCTDFQDKIGYIVSVNDLISGNLDRFRFQPNNDAMHSFELSVHYGAIYELQVSTDHPEARWSDKVVLKPPSMPMIQRPKGYIYENGSLFIVWKTIDNYPRDNQAHKLHYKVLVTYNVSNGGVRTSLDESVLVKEPPAIYQPTQTASRYYIAVNLVDDHGYVGPLSEVLHLESMEILYSKQSHPATDLILLPILLLASLIIIVYFIARKALNRPSLSIANSHYDSRSDSATLATYDNLADLDETNVYSDDAPLVMA